MLKNNWWNSRWKLYFSIIWATFSSVFQRCSQSRCRKLKWSEKTKIFHIRHTCIALYMKLTVICSIKKRKEKGEGLYITNPLNLSAQIFLSKINCCKMLLGDHKSEWYGLYTHKCLVDRLYITFFCRFFVNGNSRRPLISNND